MKIVFLIIIYLIEWLPFICLSFYLKIRSTNLLLNIKLFTWYFVSVIFVILGCLGYVFIYKKLLIKKESPKNILINY